MHKTDTPLFETECCGPTYAHVQVFPTHVIFQQRHSPKDISIPMELIASVEARICRAEFVTLRTTNRRAIISMVREEGHGLIPPNRAAALCAAIREAGVSSK
jgi:hypothetical protein